MDIKEKAEREWNALIGLKMGVQQQNQVLDKARNLYLFLASQNFK
jgi:hypothetical protein